MLIVGWTELRVEARSRRVITTMLLLGVLSLLVFAFAGAGLGLEVAVPAFWVSMALSAAGGMAQWAARTSESGVGLAIHLGAAGGVRAFVGRVTALGVVFLAVALFLGVVSVMLFDLPEPQRPVALVTAVLLGTLGFTALGGALVPFLRGRSSRLAPLLFLPLAAPLVLLASQACVDAYQGAAVSGWSLGLGLSVMMLVVVSIIVSPHVGSVEP